MSETWVTVEELAGRLGLGAATIERWIAAGLLPKPAIRDGARKLCLQSTPPKAHLSCEASWRPVGEGT